MKNFDDLISAASDEYDLPAPLLKGLIRQESNFDPAARNSKSGAVGIAQFLPSTAEEVGIDPNDPAQSIFGAAYYLRKQIDKFGSIDKGLAAYNWGQGNLGEAIKNHGDNWIDKAPDETKNYIASIADHVMSYTSDFEKKSSARNPIPDPSAPTPPVAASSPFDHGAAGRTTPYEPQAPERSWAEFGKDSVKDLAKGTAQLASGLSWLTRKGIVDPIGGMIEGDDYKPNTDAEDILSGTSEALALNKSEKAQWQQDKIEKFNKDPDLKSGFLDTFEFAIKNPTVILSAVLESTPGTLATGMVGGKVATAIGERVIGKALAGGPITAEAAAAAKELAATAASRGAGWAAGSTEALQSLGQIGQHIERKLDEAGVTDPAMRADALRLAIPAAAATLLGGRLVGGGTEARIFANKALERVGQTAAGDVAKSVVREGLEEGVQTAGEQTFQNLGESNAVGNNDPLTKGVGAGVAMGVAAGAVQGGGSTAVGRAISRLEDKTTPIRAADEVMNTADVAGAAKAVAEQLSQVSVTGNAPTYDPSIDTTAIIPEDGLDEQQRTLNEIFSKNVGADGIATLYGIPLRAIPESAMPNAGTIEGDGTVTADGARALRSLVDITGNKIIFVDDRDGKLPDGFVHPMAPDTIVLSNKPQRAADFVTRHEVKHTLETTTAPDGRMYGDILLEMAGIGVTDAGMSYARRRFSSTAPTDASPEQVKSHYLNELLADTFSSVSKTKAFMGRAFDYARAKYGQTVAVDFLTKMIDSFDAAFSKVQALFGGVPADVSKAWFSNADEIHGVMAQMLGEKMGKTAVARSKATVAGTTVATGDTVSASPRTGVWNQEQERELNETLNKARDMGKNLTDDNIDEFDRLNNRGEELLEAKAAATGVPRFSPKIEDIDAAANEAATSKMNDLPQPTDGQKEAGNYKVGRIALQGMRISIENPAGSVRSGVSKNGNKWSNTMKSHYGYILGTVGKDKDHIDTFVGRNPASSKVFIVDQTNESGGFDEHKVMLGYNSAREARAAYLENYSKGWKGLGKLSATDVEGLKKWLSSGDTTKPYSAPKDPKWSEIQRDDARSMAIDNVLAKDDRDPPLRPRTQTRLTGIMDRLYKGEIDEREVAREVERLTTQLITKTEDDKISGRKPRVRGADHFREKILRAKRNGDISEQEADLAEWLVKQNSALFDDVALSMRTADGGTGSGNYTPLSKLITLFKGVNANDTRTVHEVLHHTERMMPRDVALPIRTEYFRQLAKEANNATGERRKMFEAMVQSQLDGTEASRRRAVSLMKDKSDYQFMNPSEFWAERGASILAARMRAKDFGRVKQWMRELWQKIRSLLGLSSDAPLLRALDGILKGDGKFVSNEMLQVQGGVYADREVQIESPEFKRWFGDSKVVDDKGRPLVVYHGTSAAFTAFDLDRSVEGGVFFTTNKSQASKFGSNTIAAFLSMQNPLVVDGKQLPEEHELEDIERLVSRARSGGHDGVLIKQFRDYGAAPADTYIALRPEQIKSAIGNNGDFDPANPDIRYSPKILKPEVAETLGPYVKALKPAEAAKFRRDTAEKFRDIITTLPAVDEVAAVAYAGRAKRGWYAHSAEAMVHVFGADAPRFAALLAAMSPQTSVEINLLNTAGTWQGWVRAGKPTDRDQIVRIMGQNVQGNNLTDSVLGAWINNSVRALTSENPGRLVLSGPKVNSFYSNLIGITDEVTNDAWMANYALVDQKIFAGGLNAAGTDPGKGPGYLAMSAQVRLAARRLTKLTGETWTPAEVQETVWSWAKTLYEQSNVMDRAIDIVNARELSDELIQSTPDFRTLFHDESVDKALRAAGHGRELDSLSDRRDISWSPDEGSTARSQTAPFAEDTQLALERRGAKRLDKLAKQRAAAKAETIAARDEDDIQFSPKVNFEVAPDPNDKKAVARWTQLSEAQKFAISDRVARRVVPGYLDSIGADGDLMPQIGSYLDDTNPSFVLTVTKGDPLQIAKDLGYALSQDSMMVVSDKPLEGGEQHGAVDIELGQKTPAEIAEIYATLRKARPGADNPVSGQSYSDGYMTVLNFSSLPTEALAEIIDNSLGGKYNVVSHDVYSTLIEKKDYGYGNSQSNTGRNSPAVRLREGAVRQRVAQAIGDEFARTGAQFSPRVGGSYGPGDTEFGRGAARGNQQGKPGSVSGTGVHYSTADRKTLTASYFGTGYKGAELERVRAATDPRIQQRIYFYVNDGRGINRESGVGPYAHKAELSNVYDAAADTLDLAPGRTANEFESAVLDAGFDGYTVPGRGAAVLLGPRTVKVEPLGIGVTPEVGQFGRADKSPRGKLQQMIAENKLLPAGEVPGEMWKRMLPELDLSHLADGEKYYKDQLLKFSPKQTETPEFKRWFGDSKVVDADGNPLVVYHGTTHDFSVFKSAKANRDSDFGKGFYATNRPDDVSENYAGEGPDLTNRIELLAERIAQDNDWEYDDPRAKEKARKKLSGGAPNVMPLYLRIENPLVVGGDSPTFMDEREVKKFANYIVRAVKNDMGSPEVARAVDALQIATYEDGEWSQNIIKLAQQATTYAENNRGDLIGSEVVRKAIQVAGYDGVIDHTVSDKFGATSGRTNKMAGVDENTTHYITFKPEQIKSTIGNRGTFDPANPDIRYSPKQPIFYSQMARVIDQLMGKAEPAKELAAKVGAWARAGKYKADELQWSGLADWLQLQDGKVTKAQVAEYLANDGVQVTETVLGEEPESAKQAFARTGYGIEFDPIDRDYLYTDPDGEGVEYEDLPGELRRAVDSAYKASEGIPTKFSNWQLPGGENYRELLLTLPDQQATVTDDAVMEFNDIDAKEWSVLRADVKARYREDFVKLNRVAGPSYEKNFQSSHFDQPNILAHVRFNERTDADGNRVLFLEELQSDWAQKGRKEGFEDGKKTQADYYQAARTALEKNDLLGFDSRQEAFFAIRDNADWQTRWEVTDQTDVDALNNWRNAPNAKGFSIPAAPFVGNTSGWTTLAFKRMLRYAAENGFDKIAWTTGEQQAARYDLSKQIKQIKVTKVEPNDKNSWYRLKAYDLNDNTVINQSVEKLNDLEEIIGKDPAAKAIEQIEETGSADLRGIDLKVGGEGMKSFYDKIIPAEINKYVKRWGGKVELGDVSISTDRALFQDKQPSLTITPEMKASVLEGQPLFSPKLAPGISPPEETRLQSVQRTIQDKFNRFKVIYNWAKENGIPLSESANVYMMEALSYGRRATRVEDFREQVFQPILEAMEKAKLPMATVASYLHAMHAEERNDAIAKINPNKKDGSGMSTDAANAILTAYGTPEMKAIVARIHGITRATLKMKLDAQLISQETFDTLTDAYQNYVPLKGGDEVVATGTGKGYDVNHRMKRALGHSFREEAILENIMRDHETAIALVEKQRVGLALAQLAIELADPDLLTVGQPEKRAVLKAGAVTYEVRYDGGTVDVLHNLQDARASMAFHMKQMGDPKKWAVVKHSGSDRVAYEASPMLQENEARFYINGEAIRIQIKDPMMARQYKNMGVDHIVGVLKVGREVNAWLSKAYTGYNPEFIGVNIMRDFTEGIINLTGDFGAVTTAKVVAAYLPAMKNLAVFAATGKATRDIADYRADGGSTGASYLSDLERIGEDIHRAYNDYAGVLDTAKRDGGLAAARVASDKLIAKAVHVIEIANQAAENAMRLATYNALRAEKKSRNVAALAAKDVTLNFNRKGEVGAQMSALYLFFNPAMQGATRSLQTLLHSEHRAQAWVLVGGMMALGYALASLGAGMDEEKWDKIPNYVKGHNLVIPLPSGKQITLPMPYGYGFFLSLGTVANNLQRGKDIKDSVWLLANAFAESYSPLGNPVGEKPAAENLVQLLPTLARIPMEIVTNRSGLGGTIYPEKSQWQAGKPDSSTMFRGTKGSVWDYTAGGLNRATGGNPAQSGWVDVHPDVLKSLWSTATGGSGRFATDSAQLANLVVRGATPELREYPLIRKFVREENIGDARREFWEAAEEVRKLSGEASTAKAVRMQAGKSGNVDLAKEAEMIQSQLYAEKGGMLALSRMVTNYSKQIGMKRERADAVLADTSLPLAQRREQVKMIEAEEKQIYDRFMVLFRERKAASGSRAP